MRDTSLKLPPGSAGVVVDVRVFNRHGIEKDQRAIAIERSEIESVQEDKKVEEEILERNIKLRLNDIVKKEELSKSHKQLKANQILDKESLDSLNIGDYWKLKFKNENI